MCSIYYVTVVLVRKGTSDGEGFASDCRAGVSARHAGDGRYRVDLGEDLWAPLGSGGRGGAPRRPGRCGGPMIGCCEHTQDAARIRRLYEKSAARYANQMRFSD